MILNPFECKNCGRIIADCEVLRERVDDKIIMCCGFCGHEVFIDNPEKSENCKEVKGKR